MHTHSESYFEISYMKGSVGLKIKLPSEMVTRISSSNASSLNSKVNKFFIRNLKILFTSMTNLTCNSVPNTLYLFNYMSRKGNAFLK